MRYPDIEHHGAKDGVTGSCHQLHMDTSHSLLVDCGLFQGNETSVSGRAGAGQPAIEFSLATIQALVVTHVHIDHVGRIPYLLAAGFKGPIYCSEPSAKLLPIVLEDAFKLGFSRDQNDIERYLRLVEQRLRPLPYQQWLTLQETSQLVARIRLQRAGYVLGSACIDIDLTYPATGEHKCIIFSGELDAPRAPLVMPPRSPERAEILNLTLTTCFTEVYHSLKPLRNQEARESEEGGHKPFLLALAIVIAGNRMCSGGCIVNYLKAKRHDPPGMTFSLFATRLQAHQGAQSRPVTLETVTLVQLVSALIYASMSAASRLPVIRITMG